MEYLSSNAQVPERPLTGDELLALEPGDDDRFEDLARRVFRYQVEASPTYQVFAGGHEWAGWRNAPFLPVEAFKYPGIVAGERPVQAEFLSSATGGIRSRHPIVDLELYRTLSTRWFSTCLGKASMPLVANLPTYEVQGASSSLITMVQAIIERWASEGSCFIADTDQLANRSWKEPILLFGTAFGLLDLIERTPNRLPDGSVVIETGGMKTRRREVGRTELHEALAVGLGVSRSSILSEYGMCELASQFYTDGGDVFTVPPWVRVKIVDPERPRRSVKPGRPGLLAVFDLANAYSVSALLTSDLARLRGNRVEILGRVAGAELRGCNYLMAAEP